MRRLVFAAFLAVCILPRGLAAQAPGFSPGWYIVEECAQFFVMQRATMDPSDNSANLFIAPGEVVLAFEGARGNVYVFESFGRMSAMRPAECLTHAPSVGRPARVLNEIVTMEDIKVVAGATVWMLRYNTTNRTAVIRLNGGRELEVPSESVTVLFNAFDETMRNANFQPVHY
jgi:hypothetical protein